jgi:curved DNA-binding protein
MDQEAFRDYYEDLQLSSNADSETIERVYRMLAKRFHPDNQTAGNVDRFNQISEAYRILRDPESRAAYDVQYDHHRQESLGILEEASSDGFEDDERIYKGILSLLFISRRRDVDKGSLGEMDIERFLNCPAEHLEFHLWYLREKGWIVRTETGHLAITADGVDKVLSEKLLYRKDRLLGDSGIQESAAPAEPDVEQPPASDENAFLKSEND